MAIDHAAVLDTPTLLSNKWIESIRYFGVASDDSMIVSRESSRREPMMGLRIEFADATQEERLLPLVRECAKLLELGPGWDSYNSRAPQLHLVRAGVSLLADILSTGIPLPHVVPTVTGGIQFEWEAGSRCLEIEVTGTNRYEVYFEDEETGEEEEIIVRSDLTRLQQLVSKLG